jgi:hypothetical protein
VLVLPIRAEPIRDSLDDSPVRLAPFERREDFVKPLDAPLCTGKRALFFETGTRGEHYVGKLARMAEEDVLDDEEIKL